MISQLYNKTIKNRDGFSSIRTLALCLIALIIAGCAEFGLGRSGIDSKKPVLATVNGKAIEAKNIPPRPQHRANKTLVNAARGEGARIIETFGGVYSNQSLENQIARIVSKLVAKSEIPSQEFQITILNSPAVNALALPGGLLYVTRGLLTLANDASEVAAVLAHEMAHITSKHGQARLKKARKAELISRAVEGVISDSSTLESIQQRSQLSFAAFTQAQELDADVIGVRNAGLAGYDPYAAARFLEAMAQYQNYRTTATVTNKTTAKDFLSSHPSTPRRIQQARISARQFGAPGFGTRDRNTYLRALNNTVFGDDPSEGFVRDRSFFHPQLRFTFSVPTGYIIDNRREAVLARAENGDSIRFDGVQVPGNLTLSDYIQAGWIIGMDPQSIKSFTINGAPAASVTATVDGLSFKITLIRTQNITYRMIFATEKPNLKFDRAVSSTVTSFRSLSETEANNLSPLRIRIVKTKRGDTSFTLSRSMRGLVANPDQAFTALNGLKPGKAIPPGTLVKIITDGVSG